MPDRLDPPWADRRNAKMANDTFTKIDALEKRVESDPDSEVAWNDLLLAFSTDDLIGHPRRINRIAEFVQRFPRHALARTPCVVLDPEDSSAGFQRVEDEWLRHWRDCPADSEVARGYALFLAASRPERALEVLREAATTCPDDPELWTDMGRISQDPSQRLECLQQARRLGGKQPNLLVWIGRAAAEAGNLEAAAHAGSELLALVEQARSVHGDILDWPERGRDLWTKVRERHDDNASARAVVSAISDHANRKHWGHTILGLAALKQNDLANALEHLRLSGEVLGDHRLSSYGPSFRLARELAERGAWEAVAN
jgi:tetratricopeptide (TPR) repeat protein